jgi:hypothetical protein
MALVIALTRCGASGTLLKCRMPDMPHMMENIGDE